MNTRELIAELKGTVCRCGKAKRSMQTFCQRCYFSLPKELQRRLYDRIGEGYEQAYQDAADIFDGKKAS